MINPRICALLAAVLLAACNAPEETPAPAQSSSAAGMTKGDAQKVIEGSKDFIRDAGTGSFLLEYGVGNVEHAVDGRFDIERRKSDVTIETFGPNQGIELRVVSRQGQVIEDHAKYVGFGCWYRYNQATLDKSKHNYYRIHPAAQLLLQARADDQDAGSTPQLVDARVRLSDAVFTILPSVGWELRKLVPDDVTVPAEMTLTHEDDYPNEPGGVVETVTLSVSDILSAADGVKLDLRSAAKRSKVARNRSERNALARVEVEIFYGDFGSRVPAQFPDTGNDLVEDIDPNNRPTC